MKTNLLKALRIVTDAQLAQVALIMAEAHPESFEKTISDVMALVTEYRFEVPHQGGFVVLTHAQMTELKGTALGGNKVAGIKLIREATGLGLKEAKDLWEKMESDSVFIYNRDAYRSTY